jgi:hypothetical protein
VPSSTKHQSINPELGSEDKNLLHATFDARACY